MHYREGVKIKVEIVLITKYRDTASEAERSVVLQDMLVESKYYVAQCTTMTVLLLCVWNRASSVDCIHMYTCIYGVSVCVLACMWILVVFGTAFEFTTVYETVSQ